MLNKKVKHIQTAVTVLLLLLQPFCHDCKWKGWISLQSFLKKYANMIYDMVWLIIFCLLMSGR